MEILKIIGTILLISYVGLMCRIAVTPLSGPFPFPNWVVKLAALPLILGLIILIPMFLYNLHKMIWS